MASWTELLKSRKSILFIVICTAIVYINSLGNGFVWDDNVLLVPNEAYKKLDFGRIFFTKVNSLEYLPFRDLSYVIDYQVWGMNPFGFHLTNLLLYLISLIVLFNMVKNIAILSGEKEWEVIAFWTTLILPCIRCMRRLSILFMGAIPFLQPCFYSCLLIYVWKEYRSKKILRSAVGSYICYGCFQRLL